MKSILIVIFFSVLMGASNLTYAVEVICYSAPPAQQIGCLVFLKSYEVSNSYEDVYSDATFEGMNATLSDFSMTPKPSSTTTPAAHWHTMYPTVAGDFLRVYALMCDRVPHDPPDGSYTYDCDLDTQDEDAAGTN